MLLCLYIFFIFSLLKNDLPNPQIVSEADDKEDQEADNNELDEIVVNKVIDTLKTLKPSYRQYLISFNDDTDICLTFLEPFS
jgi:hypothetical protein